MTLKAWIPPAGEVVDPPVHPKTTVGVIWSDREEARAIAGNLNWSSFGDGPKIIAYAVVEEYVEKREPREWWIANDFAYDREADAIYSYRSANLPGQIIHVREVLPEAPLDLTKNTTPIGLLDEATQAALKAHGGPYEVWDAIDGWRGVPAPYWGIAAIYRVAPSAAPAKPAPREVVAWAVVEDSGSMDVFFYEGEAMEHQRKYGGVVRPLGFLP